jgi:hypothetical protein
MNAKKENYKVVEIQINELTKYIVRKKAFLFFWSDVKDDTNEVIVYDTKRKAQAYINFLK